MRLSPVQRDTLTLVGLADDPLVAQQLLDCWTPGHLRKVLLTLAQAASEDMSVRRILGARPIYNRNVYTGRLHGNNAGPHRCDRPECAALNRRWEADYRRARRAVKPKVDEAA